MRLRSLDTSKSLAGSDPSSSPAGPGGLAHAIGKLSGTAAKAINRPFAAFAEGVYEATGQTRSFVASGVFSVTAVSSTYGSLVGLVAGVPEVVGAGVLAAMACGNLARRYIQDG